MIINKAVYHNFTTSLILSRLYSSYDNLNKLLDPQAMKGITVLGQKKKKKKKKILQRYHLVAIGLCTCRGFWQQVAVLIDLRDFELEQDEDRHYRYLTKSKRGLVIG